MIYVYFALLALGFLLPNPWSGQCFFAAFVVGLMNLYAWHRSKP